MAVFRVERTSDYTVMSNYHLRDKALSLKAKGLLSQMLSLPDNWDFTLSGLCYINRESKDAIRTAINELEKAGYIVRGQKKTADGKFGRNEYIIYEQPLEKERLSENPTSEKPISENPLTEKPLSEKPSTENPTQLNIDITSKEELNTELPSNHSILSIPETEEEGMEAISAEEVDSYLAEKQQEPMSAEMVDAYRDLVLHNIAYPVLQKRHPDCMEELHEIAELIVETVCWNRKTTKIASSEFPHELVRSRFLTLNEEHITFVLQCLHKNTSQVRNMKQYLLTVLFNAPTTMNNQYAAQFNYDSHINGW